MSKLILLNLILFIVPNCCFSKAITSGSVWIPLVNTDYALYADLAIGEDIPYMPETTYLKVLLDTGTNEFWVPSSYCDYSKSWCEDKVRYNYLESHTYQKTERKFSTTFANQEVTGRVGIDTIQIGYDTIKEMEFGEALQSSGDLDYDYYDGVLGLGPKKESSVGSSYLQRLLEAGLDDAVLSFSIGETSGHLSIGGVSHDSYKGSMVWRKIEKEDRWQIKTDSITMGENAICESNCHVEFNTGMEITTGPREHVDRIHSLLGAEEIPGITIKSVKCDKVDTFPDITFTVTGIKVSMAPNDYIFRKKIMSKEMCYLSICTREGVEDRWVLGATSHKAIYVAYDFGRSQVGLANAA